MCAEALPASTQFLRDRQHQRVGYTGRYPERHGANGFGCRLCACRVLLPVAGLVGSMPDRQYALSGRRATRSRGRRWRQSSEAGAIACVTFLFPLRCRLDRLAFYSRREDQRGRGDAAAGQLYDHFFQFSHGGRDYLDDAAIVAGD